MTKRQQVLRAIKNRLGGMKEEARLRDRRLLQQQVEELEYLMEMLEVADADN